MVAYTAKYLFRRFTIWIATITSAIIVIFIIPRLIPGNPIRAFIARLSVAGTTTASEELVKEYIHLFGLDKDYFTQFMHYIVQLLHGNLGLSMTRFPTTVQEVIARALPWTLGLLLVATFVSFTLGTILGAILGWRGSSRIVKIVIPIALFFSQIPYYLLAIILCFLFAYLIPLFPLAGGYTLGAIGLDYFLSILWHATLPALSIILSSAGWWAVNMRALIISVMGEDYILFAEAKGLKGAHIFLRYAFRNALLPQVTGFAINLGNMISSLIVTEVIFAYPGLGWLLYDAVVNVDYNLIQGIVLLLIFSVSTAVLIIDLINPLIDPRICYEEK